MDEIAKARRLQYINALKAARDMRTSVGLDSSGSGMKSDDSSDPTDPTVYSSRSGGRGFNNLLMNNIQKVYSPEEIQQEAIKNAREELIKKQAVEELLKEGKVNFFGNQV
jgi:hypothetical protein